MTQRHNDPFMDYVQDAFKGHEVTPPPHVYAGIRSAMGGGKSFMSVGLNSALIVLLVGAVSIASWSAYKHYDTAKSTSLAAVRTPLDATLRHSQELIIGKDALRSSSEVMAEMSSKIERFEVKKTMLTGTHQPTARISSSPASNVQQGSQAEPDVTQIQVSTLSTEPESETPLANDTQETPASDHAAANSTSADELKTEQNAPSLLPEGWSTNASTSNARELLEQVKGDQEVIRFKLSVKVPANEEE